jgi:hypothetical protein
MRSLLESKERYRLSVKRASAGAAARWSKLKNTSGDAQALLKQCNGSDAKAIAGSVDVLVPCSPQKNRGSGGAAVNLDAFSKRLFALFKRPATANLNYAEQSALVEVLKSEDAAGELTELEAFSKKPDSFFPQSIDKLLTNWSPTLDRARNYEQHRALNNTSKNPRSGASRVAPDHAKGF